MNIKHDFMNREISWLAFNDRILDLAQSTKIPILERTKFLKISQSNLDEWYMIRVANLISEVKTGDRHPDKSGLAPNTQLNHVRKLVKKQFERQNKIWKKIKKQLAELDIMIKNYQYLTQDEKQFADGYFQTTISPMIKIDILPKNIPWSEIENGRLYFLVEMSSSKDSSEHMHSYFKMPSLPRIVVLKNPKHFILIENIIKAHYKKLIEEKFNGKYEAKHIYLYRILKDMDIKDLPKSTKNTEQAVEIALENRVSAPAIFLAVDHSIPQKDLKILTKVFGVNPLNTFHLYGDWNFDFTDQIKFANDDFYFPKKLPNHETELEGTEIFNNIEKRDYLLHHPYDSYDAVVNFFCQAANDPEVKKIYVTIYRASHGSPIIKALANAAKNGKKVKALIEVKARFDEEHNIQIADYLRGNGVDVYTSFPDLKIHGKIALIVKKSGKSFAHLATGNYNEQTAKAYTDFSFFTGNEQYTEDIHRIFQYISGKKKLPQKLNKLETSPNNLRTKLHQEIKRTIKKTREGEKCEIWIKCNSLSDSKIIKDLYKASREGVKVHLLIRGLTTAIPKDPDLSPHLHIHSIVGRLLEHSRIYLFINNKKIKCFLSSADIMPRNLDRRLEVLFQIEDHDLKKRIYKLFSRMWSDRAQSYVKQVNGTYFKRISNGKEIPIQEQLLNEADTKIREKSSLA